MSTSSRYAYVMKYKVMLWLLALCWGCMSCVVSEEDVSDFLDFSDLEALRDSTQLISETFHFDDTLDVSYQLAFVVKFGDMGIELNDVGVGTILFSEAEEKGSLEAVYTLKGVNVLSDTRLGTSPALSDDTYTFRAVLSDFELKGEELGHRVLASYKLSSVVLHSEKIRDILSSDPAMRGTFRVHDPQLRDLDTLRSTFEGVIKMPTEDAMGLFPSDLVRMLVEGLVISDSLSLKMSLSTKLETP